MLEDKENVNRDQEINSKDKKTTSKDKETTSEDTESANKVPLIARKEGTDNEQIKSAKASESVEDLIISTDNVVKTVDIVTNDPIVAVGNSQVEHDSDQNLPMKNRDEVEGGERESSETDNESVTVESSSGGVRKAERMFRTLSFETDINVAPVNWLRGENDQMGKCRLDTLIVLLTNS